MTYHAGIGAGFGVPPRDAHVTCDGCGIAQSCIKPSGIPYVWAMDRKPPPRWTVIRVEQPFSRKDYCPRCKLERKP